MMRPPANVPGAVPRERATMRLPTSCATKKAPRTLVSKMKSKSSGCTSSSRWVVLTPELLTKMSMEPTSVSAWATAEAMLAGSVTSNSITWALPPSASMCERKSFNRSKRRLASTTAAPAPAKVLAN